MIYCKSFTSYEERKKMKTAAAYKETYKTCDSVMAKLKSMENPANVAGMARYGINTKNTLGVSMPVLRNLARDIGKNHSLALELWKTGIHESRILACLIADPKRVSKSQMEHWVNDFDSWDVCDQCCSNLFDKTPLAYAKAEEWIKSNKEFVKRAGFVLMAVLAVHDKQCPDKSFEDFLNLIVEEANDERNFVKKAINWALRQIGKRNMTLNAHAVAAALKIRDIDTKCTRWIANDALRELSSLNVQKRLSLKKAATKSHRPLTTTSIKNDRR
jgi:3-methyladenine DNA glycosylase AlkD